MPRREYTYTPPSYEETIKRAERKSSMFDNLLTDCKTFKPKQGANLIRILPPGWPDAKHYGLTIYIHNNVGPADRRYLCLKENPDSPHKRCPVCEELYRLGANATQEDKNQLFAKPAVLYYIIDRDNEKEGIQVWITSLTTDSQIAAQSTSSRNRSVIDIVHFDDGYDIEFTRSGTTRNNTRYIGYKIMREPSPLSDSPKLLNEWLDQAFDKPLPSLLQFFPPEHIEEVFYGKQKEESPDAGRDDRRSSLRDRVSNSRDDDEDRPQLRRTRHEDDDIPVSRRYRDDDRDDDSDQNDERRDPRREGRDERVRDDRNDVDENRRSVRKGRDDHDPDERMDHDRLNRRSARNGEDRDEEQTTRRPRYRDDDEPKEDRATSPRVTRETREEVREDDKPVSRTRSRLSEDLDDEIPERGAGNGRVNGAERRNDVEERPTISRRSPRVIIDEPERQSSDTNEERRASIRARLDREA